MRRCVGIPVLLSLIWILPRLVGAVYLVAFTQVDCTGQGLLINEVVPGICYDLLAELPLVPNTNLFYRSLSFTANPTVCQALAYVQVYCLKSDPEIQSGPGPICLSTLAPTGFSSAGVICPADACFAKIMPDEITPAQVRPRLGGVVHTEDPSKGTWILETADAKEIFSQLTKVPQNEKVEWLRARGATFQTDFKV